MTDLVKVPWDPTEAKLEVERRLEDEQDSVEWLQEKIKQSSELTSGMVGILTSFEERLSRLEATILPVYQETDNLQRRQENIDKTLAALDSVIDFYNVSKEVESTVRSGPSISSGLGDLDDFLQTMSKLRGSLDYFERSNPQSIELENVRALYETGGDALAREFAELIKKHSRPIPAVDLLNILDVAQENSSLVQQHFPEDVQTGLIAIAEWLNLNDKDEFMNVYAAVRGQVMKKSLDGLRDHARSSSGKFNTSTVASDTAASSGTPTTSTKKYSLLLNKKLSHVTNKLESVTSGRRSLGTPTPATVEEHVHSEHEVEAFCLTISCLQHLMSVEQALMVGIIPHQYQRKIFEIISRDSVDAVVRDADAIVSRVKRATSAQQHDFLAVTSMYQVIRHLTLLKPSMDRTLDGCDASVKSKYNGMIHSFFVTSSSALDGFLDGIRGDSTTREKMPKDGTVFQLTSNVIFFLEQLLDYVDTVAAILTQDTSYNQTLLRLPRKISVSERNHALVGVYIKKVLVQLNITLVNKSDTYADQFLKVVFRLNNNQHILRSLQRSGLMEVVNLAQPDCEVSYNDMIMEQKRLYSESWSRVLNYIWQGDDIPVAILHGKLTDKYCKIIKEKFEGFNKEFKDICTTQRSYSIPDVEMRESLKRDNKEHICPKYTQFYEKYASVNFTKHPEKYIKYTPAEVSSQIDSFFDAAA